MMTHLSPSRSASSSALMAAALLAVGLYAGDAAATNIGLSDVTKNVGNNVRQSVPLVPMLSYVIGVFFTASGLLKLKDWVNDGERNSITPALMRLVVATFMIILPHMIRMTTGTFFRRDDGMFVNVKTNAPQLGAFCKSSNPDCN